MNKILKIAALAAAFVSASPAIANATNLLNTIEYRSDSLDVLPQWQRVLTKIDREQAGYRACAENTNRCSSQAVKTWQKMIKDYRSADPVDQLHVVNRFINQWRYLADNRNYGRSDYWASPGEFFKRSGDCEDYAIAKYATLRQMGFSADQLRLVVVNDVHRNIAHAVLAVYVGDKAYILDNLNNEVRLHSNAARDYTPYYSVNEQARWAHAATPRASDVAPASDAPAGGLPSAKSLFSRS